MLAFLVNIFILMTVVDAVVSFVPDLRHHKAVQQLRKIVDVPQRPLRQLLPPNLPFDLSPLIVIFILRLLVEVVQ